MIRLMLTLFVCLAINAQAELSMEFPNESLRQEIAQKLFDGIEEIDAMTYEVRNKTRDVDWATFRTASSQNIVKAKNWNEFYQALSHVHFGIINRHSFVLVQDAISTHVTKKNRWPKYKMGYTWPEVDFFAVDSKKSVQSIAGFAVQDLFDQFYNFYCNDAHKQGCLARFVRYVGVGYFFEEYREKIAIKFTDGSQAIAMQINSAIPSKQNFNDCSNTYPQLNKYLSYESQQVCLFVLPEKNVIKIQRFGKWGAAYSDIYCVNPHSEGMCSDINQIKSLLNEEPLKELVIDLQGNGGGSEVTPWLAALTKSGFYDNRVQYKNLQYLQIPDIRENAFYYSKKAENWYKSLTLSEENALNFLPARGDFCRASDMCKIALIKSAQYPISYSQLKLITDQNCVSSCDDFVWRLKQYAGAKVYGQPPATDGAYARLHGYLFLSDQGKINQITLGEDQAVPKDKGVLLVSYRIPISRTVDKQGQLLEGDDSVLDVALSVNQANYQQIKIANLNRVLSL